MDNQSESVGLDAGKGPIRSTVSRTINDHFALILIGVPALTILVLFIWPVIWVLFQSVWVDYPGVPSRFDPIGNYEQVYIRSRFYSSLRRTMIYAFGSLGLSVTSGLLLALALNQLRRRWIRTAYVTVLTLGWAIPVSILGLIWRWILHESEAGLINLLLLDLGVIDSPIGFLLDGQHALLIVTLIDAWVRMPMAMIIFLAGLQAIPNRIYEAAMVDGATTLQRFRHVTIPHLRPYIVTVCLIVWLFAFQAFSVIWVMTGGGPGLSTETISLFIFEVGILQFNFNAGAAISSFLVAVSLVLTAFYVKYFLDNPRG